MLILSFSFFFHSFFYIHKQNQSIRREPRPSTPSVLLLLVMLVVVMTGVLLGGVLQTRRRSCLLRHRGRRRRGPAGVRERPEAEARVLARRDDAVPDNVHRADEPLVRRAATIELHDFFIDWGVMGRG